MYEANSSISSLNKENMKVCVNDSFQVSVLYALSSVPQVINIQICTIFRITVLKRWNLEVQLLLLLMFRFRCPIVRVEYYFLFSEIIIAECLLFNTHVVLQQCRQQKHAYIQHNMFDLSTSWPFSDQNQ